MVEGHVSLLPIQLTNHKISITMSIQIGLAVIDP
jgi:hypothetical protein